MCITLIVGIKYKEDQIQDLSNFVSQAYINKENYYENIPDNQFVPLTKGIDKSCLGMYEINKKGDIKTLSTGKIRYSSNHKKNLAGYPIVVLGKNPSRARPIHILLANTFLPNPDHKPIIDHVNRNKLDFSLKNLRWANYSENAFNRDAKRKSGKVVYAKLDENGNEIERIDWADLDKTFKSGLNTKIHANKRYKGYYWKRIDLEVENYIKEFGEPKDNEWKQCLRLPQYECNLNGLMRVSKTKRLVIGYSYITNGYRIICHGPKSYRIHRLIYETFSEELLSDEDIIDHISTVCYDNRFSNLRKGNMKDNMNNPLTKKKITKSVKQYTLSGDFVKEYNNVEEAAEIINSKSPDTIRSCANGRSITYLGYYWCYSGEEEKVFARVNKNVFKYNKDGELIQIIASLRQASSFSTSDRETISKAIKTGSLCNDGYYYSRGPRDFKDIGGRVT